MFKFFLIGSFLLLTVGCSTIQEGLQPVSPHLTIIKDVAYSLVIKELEGIIDSSKYGYIWPGAADPVILNVSNAFIARNKADPKKQELIDTNTQHVRILMNTLSGICQKLNSKDDDDQYIIKFDETAFNEKFRNLENLVFRVHNYYRKFGHYLTGYKDIKVLAPKLRKLTEELRQERLDKSLMEMAVKDEAGLTDSLVFAYAKFLESNNLEWLSTSPNQQIMWFYQTILMHSESVNVLLEISYELLQELENKNLSSDLEHVRKMLASNEGILTKAAKETFNRFSHLKYQYVSVHQVENDDAIEGVNFFQLNRLWYTYITTADQIRNIVGDSQCKTCDRYRKVAFNNFDHCAGQLMDCKRAGGDSVEVRIVNDNNRYMSGYKVNSSEWFGAEDGEGTSVTYRGSTQDGVECAVCNCTCNHFNGANSDRYFYSQAIPVPDGFVVTGLKFVKQYYSSIQKNVVFIQPQVAELINLGLVNASTIRWLDLPSTVAYESVHKLGHPGYEEMWLGYYSFKTQAYVTGLRFNYENYMTVFNRLTIQVSGNKYSLDMNGKIHLGEPIVASRSDGSILPFYNTGEKADAGQHIIPAFDSQDFTLNDPMPLAGLNIQYYNVSNINNNMKFIYAQLRTTDFGEIVY